MDNRLPQSKEIKVKILALRRLYHGLIAQLGKFLTGLPLPGNPAAIQYHAACTGSHDSSHQ